MTKDPKLSTDAAELGHRTEAHLRVDTAKDVSVRAKDDSERLVHELQAHQMALEMQSEDLRQSGAEAEVGAALRRYADLYDLAPAGYLTLGCDGEIRHANLTGTRLLGVERNQLLGRRFEVFVAEPDRPAFNAFLKKVYASQSKEVFEVALLKPEKGPLNVHITAMVSQDSQECHAMMVDITERKQIENALLFLLQHSHSASGDDFFQSLARYLAETLGMDYACIGCLDGDGLSARTMAVYFDGKFEDNLAYALKDTPCGDVVRKNICAFPRDVRQLFPRDVPLQAMLAESYVGTPLWSSKGQPIGLIAVIGRQPSEDLSLAQAILSVVAIRAAGELERRQAEAERVEALLAESEERYRILIESMNDGFAIADERGVLTYVNKRLCEMSGYSSSEMIGRPVREFLDENNRRILDVQLDKRKKGEQQPYEIAWTRKDGITIHSLVSPTAVFIKMGQFTGSFAVISDITERKKSEDLLRKAFSEIKVLKDQLEAENVYFRQEVMLKQHPDHIIGQSNALKYVLYRAEQVASANTTVIILGETGTGKGLLASAIHQMSPCKDRPLVTVNCAALPQNLIESELFGREKGAFTGAETRQVGRFEIANCSTICLDEIAELPLEVQAKLLRVLQHNEFERLGSSRTIKVNVRIVATTNRDLKEEVRKGKFRQDLFYRINVFPITVPPLRQRKEDIPLLVEHLTTRFARKMGKQFKSIHKDTLGALQDYPWPGNIRELENVIERAVVLCPGPVLQLTDKLEAPAVFASSGLKTLEEAEREQILKTLLETRWRINGKKGAAAILGLHPSTLRARMHKLGIRRPEIKTSD